MILAVQTLDYQGTFVYLQNNQLETMEITRLQRPEGARERLVSLNGSPREVVREAGILACFLPDSDALLIDRHNSPEGGGSPEGLSLDALSRNYSFRFLGEDRVAGRQARVVAIIPQDAYRYGYRIYVDAETSLPLKSDLMDEHGNPVEQTMFTSLKVGAEVPLADLAARGDSLPKPSRKQTWETGESPHQWVFAKLPQGFSVNLHERYYAQQDEDDAIVHHFVLSDGLASLSVFVEKIVPGEGGLRGGSRMGAVSAWGAQIDGHQVTGVGEVPLLTLREVLAGLHQAYLANEPRD
jgi:sigma-E factor negative regulatory protein RseB